MHGLLLSTHLASNEIKFDRFSHQIRIVIQANYMLNHNDVTDNVQKHKMAATPNRKLTYLDQAPM
jgi:hypothetical protein